jgi:predicted Fe-Mo cluster-binding NifX family protein
VKVAIAVQNDSVCPRLDRAQQLIVIETHGPREQHRTRLDIRTWPAHGRAERLARLGVDAVVCGGVCGFDEAGFDASTTRLISGVAGPIEAVIEALSSGTIEPNHDYWRQEPEKSPREP